MKVLTVEPVQYGTGDVLPPEDLNRTFLYARRALIDVSQKRWARAPLVLPFREAVNVPYTNPLTEEHTYRFTPPVDCIIERGFFHGDLTCTAELQVVIEKASDSSTPTGCTVPYLSTANAISSTGQIVSATGVIASAASDVQNINVDRVLLKAGVEYKIRLAGGGVFSLSRFDVILHVAVDRWSMGGALALPDFNPTLMVDGGADATVPAANIASLNTEAAKLAAALTAPVPALLGVVHGLTNATLAGNRQFTIPRVSSARAKMKLKRIYLYVFTTSLMTISAQLKDETGANVGAAINAAVNGQLSVDSLALAVALDGSTPEDATKDYALTFATASAGTCVKAYAVGWFARS